MLPRIALRRFSVSYPTFTLEPISLEVLPGERVALVGPNGSGKSTTLRALAGRLPEYEGTILLDGNDLRGLLPLARTDVGLLPETLAGYSWMTVRQHLAFLREFYPKWDSAYESYLTERLRVPVNEKVGRLSKGTRMKLSFVAAESSRPPLLLLDEPTSGLDPEVRRELIDTIRGSSEANSERVVLFSTHLLEDVGLLADRVLILANGKLSLDARISRLRDSHGGENLAKVLYTLLARSAC